MDIKMKGRCLWSFPLSKDVSFSGWYFSFRAAKALIVVITIDERGAVISIQCIFLDFPCRIDASKYI